MKSREETCTPRVGLFPFDLFLLETKSISLKVASKKRQVALLRAMMASASAESVRAREARDETEKDENGHPEEHVAFLEKWNQGKTRGASACRCSFVCLGSSANVSRALLSATAKAAVYQSAGKIFGDARSAVPTLSAELVGHLVGDKGGLRDGTGSAGVLSDLHKHIEAWCESKKTWTGGLSESFGGAKAQSEAVDVLTKSLSKGEGWLVADRERTALELLLLYDKNQLAHCEETYETGEELLRHKCVCSFRPTQCENAGCVEVFSANVAGGHDAHCPHKMLPCPQGCGESVKRSGLPIHIETECARRPAECPFKNLGCDARCDAGTLERHVREETHAHLALVAASLRGIVYDAATRDAKTAALSLAVADVVGRIAGPVTRQMDGLELAAESAEKTALTAVAVAKKTEKEHDALFAGVAKAIANLEAESKAQKKAIAAVVVSVEKLTKCTKAHEDAVKAMAAAAAK